MATLDADFAGDGTDVVLKVAEMGTELEVVALTIRDYAAVDYVDLANAPTIESRFMKEVFEDVVRAYLDVPGACPKAADGQPSRYGTGIGCVGKPQNGGWVLLVELRNDSCFQPLKYSRIIAC